MSRLKGRLRKLEARLTDRSGLVPRTSEWFDYWTTRMAKLINGEAIDEKIPFEFLEAPIKTADAADDKARATQ
jgi:hypothetical protein